MEQEIARVISNDTFSVAPSGAVAQPEKDTEHNDKFDEILEKLQDPNCSAAEVSRLITVELGKVARDSVRSGKDPGDAWKQKSWETQVKVLSALAKQLSETEVLSKKDNLNFDGPKFKWVLGEIVNLFKKTLEECNFDSALTNNILLQFSDKMAEAEPRIRREAEKVVEFVEMKKTK